MCGRYSFSSDQKKLREQFGDIAPGQNLEINFNIAPTQKAYVLTDDTPGELQQFRWGLIPFWAKDEKIGSRMINARAETLLEKPAFRTAARKRHCWVLADSFYEWKKVDGKKVPHRIFLKDGKLMVIAGLWENWTSKEDGEQLSSFTIITCAPNQEMLPIHNRMPVILSNPQLQQAWLENKEPEAIRALIQTPPDDLLTMYPVSTQVNSVRNNGASLHDRVEDTGPAPDLFNA